MLWTAEDHAMLICIANRLNPEEPIPGSTVKWSSAAKSVIYKAKAAVANPRDVRLGLYK